MDVQAPLRRSSEHRLLCGGAVAGLLLLLAMGFLLKPDARGYGTHERLGFAPCMPMEVWNVPCPGCGVTTSVTHAVRGELAASLRTQPFGLALFIAVLVFAVWAFFVHLSGRDVWIQIRSVGRPRLYKWGGAICVLFVASWFYKLVAVRGWSWLG